MKNNKNLPFFVYGTLLPGQPNDHYWQDHILQHEPAVFLGGKLYSFTHFPMMIESDEIECQVIGEIIWVEPEQYDSIMHHLDLLENYNPADHDRSPYQRLVRSVINQAGDEIPAWTYIGRADLVANLPQIPDGDWAKFLQNRDELSQNQNWWRNRSTDQLL